MGLSRLDKVKYFRLGNYIERSTINNKDLKYGNEYITGVNNKGVFAEPKGNVDGVNLKPYKIVDTGAFVYNPSRLDLGSLAYRTEGICIVSHLYQVFYLNNEGKKVINPTYLFMYFCRKEFHREVSFRNFGSQRPEFNLNDMSEIELPLPPIEIQNKYVDIYNAMKQNQQAYETGLEDLKLTCDAYIERLQKTTALEKIGPYIELTENKNNDLSLDIFDVRGISIEKKFIDTKADMTNVSLKSYYIVSPNEFAYVTVTSRNGEKISLARNDSENKILCSSSYIAFKVKSDSGLIPSYLSIFFNTSDFDRYARFHSWGSARETFSWEEMCNVKIPIPETDIQQAIVDIYTVYQQRKQINERLKVQIKDICPILIKGALAEGAKAH